MLWLLSQVVSTLRTTMAGFAISFLLTIVVMAVLWWVTPRVERSARQFWRLLALAWTVNLAGNIAWSMYSVLVSEALPIFTWIDGFYLLRYFLVGWALWRYPRHWDVARWGLLAVVTVIAAGIVWQGLFSPVLGSFEQPVLYFLGGALYPILDATLLYAALLSWITMGAHSGKVPLGLFVIALLGYGIANWINFIVRSHSLAASNEASFIGASFFWLLSDVLTGFAALWAGSKFNAWGEVEDAVNG
ncbi:MAG: hypothetical protein JW981_00815 [Anaerolineae bacterium]|nr:hypothetical protein [Anaerolineae bacterium]